MRRIKQVLLFAAMIIALGSCKKDPVFTLVGTWDVASITTEININNMINLPPEVQEDVGEIEFRDDNTGKLAMVGEFTWSLLGNNLSVSFDDATEFGFPDMELELTTMEPEKVVGEYTLELDKDELDNLLDLIDDILDGMGDEYGDIDWSLFIQSMRIKMTWELLK